MELSHVAERPGVLSLTVAGKPMSLLLSPLFVDELELLRDRLIATGRRLAGDGYARLAPLLDRMPAGDRAVAVQKIVKDADDEPALARRGADTVEGVAFEVWLRCRRNHPDVTLAEITASIDDDNRDAVSLAVRDIAATHPAKKG